mmetsp:Transcript_14261/g.39615  ORF Transcript_14261/g.39615 Transcript_14261/m.39615 type:complete len:509 (-) Transcript_14261:78-1604(-)
MIQRRRYNNTSLFSLLCLGSISTVLAGSALLDASGNLRLISLPDSSAPVVAVVTSPGTPSTFTKANEEGLTYDDSGALVCQGATLGNQQSSSTTPLATASIVAGSLVLDGISLGDLEAGLRDSRHGRTLMSIFRAKLSHADDTGTPSKQTLILPVQGDELSSNEAKVTADLTSLFSAAAMECGSTQSFAALYELKIVPYTNPAEIMTMASNEAGEASGPLSEALTTAYSTAKKISNAQVSPLASEGLVMVGSVYSSQSRTVRAKLASWKVRVARGLVVDGFGSEAEKLLDTALKTYDTETVAAAGIALAAAYRREMRLKLQALVETGIQEAFDAQIENLEKSSLKRMNAQMLKTVNEPAETIMDANAAILRNEAFAFEAKVDDLEVPSLSLTKERAVRDMTGKLNDAVMSFPDSPAAKIKRTGKVNKVVKKDKKPGQGLVDLGLDLVAVLRPDGFGTFQGFAGYQLGGNSITVGVHNDADDPQTIAQFGGVRPPLLRVQPKIRMDVEL